MRIAELQIWEAIQYGMLIELLVYLEDVNIILGN